MAIKYDKFSFSTSWNWRNSHVGKKIIEEIMELGFGTVELNYRITEEMLTTILPMIEAGKIKISSIHNVFPYVNDKNYDTDSMLLGYVDKVKRKEAIRLTKGSIDWAARFGAKAVVIHPGEVPQPLEFDYREELENMYNEGLKGTNEYKKLFDEMMEYKNSRHFIYLQLIKESMEELCEYISTKNYDIKLGLENRVGCMQIPDFYEINYLLDKLKDLPVYFWYDMGHGTALESLGMFNNLQEVKKIKNRILGMHIHDCIGIDDHWTPYVKSNNVDNFIDIIKGAPIKVLELGAKNKKEDIEKGVNILNEKLEKALKLK